MVCNNRIVGSDGYRYNFGPIPHDFNHLEQLKGKFGKVRDIFQGGFVFGLQWRPKGPPHMWVPWDRKNGFVKMGAFIHDYRPTQPDFNHQEPGDKKCGCAGSVLGCFQAVMGASGAPVV